eukprot:1333670-Amorphochlora_amoeboformis.AAC.1
MLPLSLYRDGMRANAVKARGKLKPVFTVLWDEMKAMVYVANSVVVQSRVKKKDICVYLHGVCATYCLNL